ncbi:hypothetical protein LINPERHAP1_LOCUS25961 [Linum perenne]
MTRMVMGSSIGTLLLLLLPHHSSSSSFLYNQTKQRNTLLYQNVQVVVLDHQCSVDALASSCIKVTSSSIGTSFFIIIISKFKALCFSSTWNVDTYTHTHMSLPNKVF